MDPIFNSKADGAHALLSASGAARWSTCHASVRLESAIPERPSKYADEGTAAHTVGSWCLLNDAMPDAYPDPAVEVNGVQWPVTQEMKNAVADYLAVVRKYAETGTLLVEQRVDYSHWIDVEDSFGTSDAVVLGNDEWLTIIDLKYGMGVPVHAYETGENGKPVMNSQLGLYALGAMYEYEQVADFRFVRMVICQPRLDHVSVCEVDTTDLKTFALRMKVAARRAMDVYESVDEPAPDKFAPSDKACQWCAAKHSCPALAAQVEEETRDLFGALVEHGASAMAAAVPEDRLAQAMAKVGLIEDFCSAIRSEVERRLLAGHPVPGFKLVEGRKGSRRWKDEEKAEKDLRRVLGAKDAVEIRPISPTTVEKNFVKRGLLSDRVWANLNKNIEQSDGKPSVAPNSDSRPAIKSSASETVFAQLAASVAEDLV